MTPHDSRPPIRVFIETVEQLVLAFVLAFVFRAFVIEAFVIPTGSMADTLRGAHFHLTCDRCGYEYNFGFIPRNHAIGENTNQTYAENTIPSQPIRVAPMRHRLRNGTPICPMCGAPNNNNYAQWVHSGDRILVQKFIYQFREPRIWDVVVFKNPTDPTINYIKRLIGTPGDTIEIIDGDIYRNGMIQRKPKHVQDTLWIKAFDVNYDDFAGGKRLWQPAFVPEQATAAWSTNVADRSITFAGSTAPQILQFNQNRLNHIVQNFCAYNGPTGDGTSVASDLKFAAVLTADSTDGTLDICLSKYDRTYTARFGLDGTAVWLDADQQPLTELQNIPLRPDEPVAVSAALVDHRLVLTVGDEQIVWDGPDAPADWGYDPQARRVPPPTVSLAASGTATLNLQEVCLYRDTHYSRWINNQPARGSEGYAITLGDDEFFVLGDNSPASSDSRAWTESGRGNGDVTYRPGIVPRDYMIGRAFFVYWPAGYRWPRDFKLALVPNVGDMRFIY